MRPVNHLQSRSTRVRNYSPTGRALSCEEATRRLAAEDNHQYPGSQLLPDRRCPSQRQPSLPVMPVLNVLLMRRSGVVGVTGEAPAKAVPRPTDSTH